MEGLDSRFLSSLEFNNLIIEGLENPTRVQAAACIPAVS